MKLMKTNRTRAGVATKAGMDEKTARKYLRVGKLPSEVKSEHTWRTRTDPFEDVWDEVKAKLELNSGLEAKTLFEYRNAATPASSLMESCGHYSDGSRYGEPWKVPLKRCFSPSSISPESCARAILRTWISWE